MSQWLISVVNTRSYKITWDTNLRDCVLITLIDTGRFTYGRHHSLGQVPGLYRQDKVSRVHTFISLCFLMVRLSGARLWLHP